MDQEDVEDIKAKADGPGNLKDDGPRKMSKTSELKPTVQKMKQSSYGQGPKKLRTNEGVKYIKA